MLSIRRCKALMHNREDAFGDGLNAGFGIDHENPLRFTPRDLAEPAPPPYADSPEDDLRSRVLALLGPTPLPIDEVIRMSGLAPRVVLAALTELELDGDALRLDGSRVALRIG